MTKEMSIWWFEPVIFPKIRGDSVVDAGGKFATSVNETGGVKDTEKLPPVSTTQAANLPVVSRYQQH